MFGFGKAEKISKEELRERVIENLKTVFDPEIPVNIYDLGLIYDVEINDDYDAHVKMTLTTPGCPVAATFPGTVEQKVREVDGVMDAYVELVWEPPWTKDNMSQAARIELGMFD